MLIDNPADLRLRLEHSIVLYKDKPVYVSEVEEWYLILVFLSNLNRIRVSYKNEKGNFNFTPIPLGYMQTQRSGYVYITRLPRRMYKQGLTVESCFTANHENFSFLNNLTHLYNCIVGNYPDIEQAIIEAKSTIGYVAFSRNFATDGKGNLVYKGQVSFGRYLPELTLVSLNPGMEWMKETVQEELGLKCM